MTWQTARAWRLALLLAGLGSWFAGAALAHAAEFTVDDGEDLRDTSPGDGTCATSAGRCSLRAALDETNALAGADTVFVPPGYYRLTLGQLEIVDDLTLVGEGPEWTILDADHRSRVLAVFPDGLIVSDRAARSVRLYDRSGSMVRSYLEAPGTNTIITAVAVDSGLHVLTLDSLRTFDLETGASLGSIALPRSVWHESDWPADLLFAYRSVEGRYERVAFMLDYTGQRVLAFAPETGVWSASERNAAGLSSPNSLTLGVGGSLLVTNTGSAVVSIFDRGSLAKIGEYGAAGTYLSTPRGIAIDNLQRVYVADETSRAVWRFEDASARPREFIARGAGGLQVPSDIAFGPSGDLYVVSGRGSDTLRAVLRFDGATGAHTGTLLAGSYPGVIAYVQGAGRAPRVTLRGLTLENGLAGDTGAAGGGVYSAHKDNHLTIDRCVLRNHESRTRGGGIYSAGTLTLDRSVIEHNRTATDGGGGVMYTGGGLYNAGLATITRSTVSSNQATRGGGIANIAATMTIQNSTITWNSASTRGGGLLNIGRSSEGVPATLKLSFSTVTQNYANQRPDFSEHNLGGGIYNSENLQVANSIVAGNHAGDTRGTWPTDDCYSGPYSADAPSSAVMTSMGGNLWGILTRECQHTPQPLDRAGTTGGPLDPRLSFLTSLSGNGLPVHTLLAGSQAIDSAVVVAGDAFFNCPADDETEQARPYDGYGDGTAVCDSGAYEDQPSL